MGILTKCKYVSNMFRMLINCTHIITKHYNRISERPIICNLRSRLRSHVALLTTLATHDIQLQHTTSLTTLVAHNIQLQH